MTAPTSTSDSQWAHYIITTNTYPQNKKKKRKSEKADNQRPQIKASCGSLSDHLDLKGMARITTWWYKAASAAPAKGPTQNIHCRHPPTSKNK